MSRSTGRHRAAVPATPSSLSLVTTAVVGSVSTAIGGHAGTAGRRAAVITASSGLVVSMGVTVADAAPVTEAAPDRPATASLALVRTAAALPVVEAAVTVAPDVASSVTAGPSLSEAAPPPPPPPPPVVEAAASRSGERSAFDPALMAPVTAEGVRAQVIEIANRYVGIPYRYGGTTPSGFDCSGFTSYVFAQVGVDLPRTSGAQSNAGTRVSAAEALPGDLVWKPGHVGIYVGGGLMIDSPQTGDVVKVHPIRSSSVQFIRVL